eukprot:610123-Rhodomonas_salina.2
MIRVRVATSPAHPSHHDAKGVATGPPPASRAVTPARDWLFKLSGRGSPLTGRLPLKVRPRLSAHCQAASAVCRLGHVTACDNAALSL